MPSDGPIQLASLAEAPLMVTNLLDCGENWTAKKPGLYVYQKDALKGFPRLFNSSLNISGVMFHTIVYNSIYGIRRTHPEVILA